MPYILNFDALGHSFYKVHKVNGKSATFWILYIKIQNCPFSSCSSLVQISIPPSVKTIGIETLQMWLIIFDKNCIWIIFFICFNVKWSFQELLTISANKISLFNWDECFLWMFIIGKNISFNSFEQRRNWNLFKN